jgi:hypothetical protein
MQHRFFECPVGYFQQLGEACPGFDERGARVVAAWTGDNIRPATAAAWQVYIAKHNLPPSKIELRTGKAAFST